MEKITVNDVQPITRRHSYEYRAGSLSVLFDQVYSHSNRTIDAWVEVRWRGNVPPPTLLHASRHDITGPRFAQTVTSLCQTRLSGVTVDWPGLVEACRFDVVRQIREGRPASRLAEITPTQARWLLRPLIVNSGATSLVAPGGSNKSMLALAAAVMVASNRASVLQLRVLDHGPVLYLDWEASAEDQAERLRAICDGAKLDPPQDLWHLPQDQPLYRTADSLSRFVEEEGVKLLVVDSVILARAGDAFGPEETVRFYAALRHIGIPSLLVDHKSRDAIRANRTGAYGSVVNDNSSRLMYEAWPVIAQGPDKVLIKLSMTKRNNVGLAEPLGYEIGFTNQGDRLVSIRFTQVPPASIIPFPDVEEGSTLADLIVSILRQAGTEGMLVRQLSDVVGKDPGQVRARLNELEKQSQVTKRTIGSQARWWASTWDDQDEIEESVF